MPSGASLATLGAAGIGAASSSMGKNKQTQTTMPELPPELKDAFLKQILPASQEVFNRPRPLQEYERVGPAQDGFDSNELFKLQQASDAKGGLLFNSRKTAQPVSEEKAMSPNATKQIEDQILGRALFNQIRSAPRYEQAQYGTMLGGFNPQTDADYAALGRLGAIDPNPKNALMGLLNSNDMPGLQAALSGVEDNTSLIPMGLLTPDRLKQIKAYQQPASSNSFIL
jgi:hypothetical protein